MVTEDRKSKRKAHALNRSRAREMRHNPVSMEEVFWDAVRNRKLGGFKFKRQYLIGNYIADFVCLEHRLVIELDGKLHEGREGYDAARDAFFRTKGFDVYRIMNEDMAHNFASVMSSILHELTAPSPQPSPPLRGGEGEAKALPSPPRSGGEGRVRGR
ncbi:MAG: endonuclease domain-containing protein [Alphaproteobacteria bacterium]|nr:endonuclease domain-containing protein [Alphaproteobacteria bacterium]MBL6938805.1 endonuclease domain-containing protein [Alphaproteobacteria bacterium]MBL7097838.1 endonuclease domain-containing protein [Alphaproteobacteria bacterium]